MGKIIIIEDEILVASGIEDIVTNNGYEVIGKATNYSSGKKLILTEKCDLILCDINLNSEKTGIDLMTEIKDKFNIPFIFITAYSDNKTISNANNAEPVNYITKPFNEKQLLVSIERAMLRGNSKTETKVPTEPEINILKQLSKGLNSKEVSEVLLKSQHTIETQRKNMIKRFDVKNTTELVSLAISEKWISYMKE